MSKKAATFIGDGMNVGVSLMKHHLDFLLKAFDINSININGFTKKLERKLSGIDKGKKSEYLYYLIQGNK